MAGTQRQTLAADVTVLHKRMALFTVAVLRMPLHMMIFLHKMCVGTGGMRSLLMFMMVFVVVMVMTTAAGVAALVMVLVVVMVMTAAAGVAVLVTVFVAVMVFMIL